MATEWTTTTIGEQATLQRGMDITKAEQHSGAVPVISSGGVLSYHDTPAASGPGVILGRKGVVGSVYFVDSDYWPHDTTLWVKDFHGNDRRFVYYFFKWMAPRIAGMDVGSANPTLNRNHVHPIEILWPPVPEQCAIAHILGALDDKVQLNRRMNETLEAITRALFKAWFVELEPVRIKAADLIRDGVLEIGDGYRAKNSELQEPGLPFIRAGDLNNGFDTSGADVLREDSVAKAGTKVSRPGDVAFTSKGTIGRFARVTAHTEPFVYSPQVCFWRSLDREKLHPAILYCWMQSDDLKSQVEAVAGQTDMAPYVSLRDQRQMEVPIFPESQQVIGTEVDSLLARQALVAMESKSLAAMRDTLLPKLISGELRISEGERIAEGHI
jgi:type I restriction enzyme S subunit